MLYSAVFRAKARAVLQRHWQTALLIALIVNLPSLLVQGIGSFTHTDLSLRLQSLMLDASSSQAALDALPEAIRALLSETGVLVMLGFSILAWLVTPALSLGMNHWTLDRVRGAEEPVATVFSRLRIFFKGAGLRLYIALMVVLWTLPGAAVSLLSLIPALNARGAASASLFSSAQLSLGVMYLGMILMIVLGVLCYLRFAMADLILADEPEEGVLACARRSRELMKGRRGALLSLMLSFLLWYLLILFVSSFAAGMLGDVFSLMIQMLGSLFLSVYMLAAQCVFYEALRKAPRVPVTVDPEEEPGTREP